MGDHELLELAARAAGIELLDFYGERYSARIIATNKLIGWNALTDDGDALRLAVDLDLIVSRDYLTGERTVLKYKASTIEQLVRVAESLGDDPCAATRRAIVRAAAAIAQEMTDAQG